MEKLLRRFASEASDKIINQTIRKLQALNNRTLLPSGDPRLGNIWDEICVQVQGEESGLWDFYLDMINDTLRANLDALPDHQRQALWLFTNEGWEWRHTEPEYRDPEPPVCHDDTINDLRHKLMREAADWSNSRIRAYLGQDDYED
jgi:hypothetical protein